MLLLFCTYRISHETSPILNQLSQSSRLRLFLLHEILFDTDSLIIL